MILPADWPLQCTEAQRLRFTDWQQSAEGVTNRGPWVVSALRRPDRHCGSTRPRKCADEKPV